MKIYPILILFFIAMLHQVDLKVQLLAGFAILVASIAEVETFLRFLLLIALVLVSLFRFLFSRLI
jgi:hypothetical protein